MKAGEDDNGEMRTQGSAHLKFTDNVFAWEKGSINFLLQEQVGTLWKTEIQTEEHKGVQRNEGKLKTDA